MLESKAAGAREALRAVRLCEVCRRMCHSTRAACAADVPSRASPRVPPHVSLPCALVTQRVTLHVPPGHHRMAGACLDAALAL